jgi:hypothetical protein
LRKNKENIKIKGRKEEKKIEKGPGGNNPAQFHNQPTAQQNLFRIGTPLSPFFC